jgi:hypothetical protein
MMHLSWDLHIHPAPSSVPRWGDGAAIQAACARAGVAGFVWKSHDMHSARLAAALAPAPRAFGSASLNAWATPQSVIEALADGARWVWGPTYRDGKPGWELPLPAEWTAHAAILLAVARSIVLGTGHLGAEGRRTLAALARETPALKCSVTHALYLAPEEVRALAAMGCVFEVDLYTATRAIHGRPDLDLVDGLRRLLDAGVFVYLVTDAGQVDVGDPYVFSERILDDLVDVLGEDTVRMLAVDNPRAVVAHVTEAA